MRKGDTVTTGERDTRYRVERVHKDGSVTVRALFALDAAGRDRLGYLGYLYRVGAESFVSMESIR